MCLILFLQNARKRFRDAQKTTNQILTQFHAKLRNLFEKWVTMAEIEIGCVALRELCIKK